ncbi:MAG: LysM peptidoglycan-binding domain-containing protein [Chitinophagaceae bacterium]|nr:LysM peptidoglycan-binding domain-containing protein [Chitinophagaceae bacterium]
MNRKSNGKMIQVLSYTFSYVVKKGETLSELATKFGTSVDEVQKQNNIKDANTISEGQKIKFRQTVYGGGSYGGGGAGGDTGNSN